MNRLSQFIVFALCLVGCSSPPDSEFRFHNRSETTIWVDEVAGFEFDPRCGVLVPGATAELNLWPQDVPEAFSVKWWKGDRTNRESEAVESQLTIKDIPSSQRTGVLVFEFRADETWQVGFESR